MIKQWFIFAVITLSLNACSSTPAPPLSPISAKPFPSIEAATDLSEVGALAIFSGGSEYTPMTFRLNGQPLGVGSYSYFWLPLYPGNYNLSYFVLGSDAYEKNFSVSPGDKIYLTPGFSKYSEYEQVSRDVFLERLSDWFGGWSFNRRSKPENPLHSYLPPSQRQIVEVCLDTKIAEDCETVIENIPSVLIDSNLYDTVRSASINKKAPANALIEAAESPQPTVALAPAPRPSPELAAPLVNLPPEIERDRLMVKIADLFEAGNAADALPLFGRLDSLPVPIDPSSDFYWAQSLLANGDRQGAAARLSRFLRTIDSSSEYYAPALRLMTRIEG